MAIICLFQPLQIQVPSIDYESTNFVLPEVPDWKLKINRNCTWLKTYIFCPTFTKFVKLKILWDLNDFSAFTFRGLIRRF